MTTSRVFYRINHQIRARQVRLIDTDGTQIGIVSIDEALKRAQERRLDLVEISPSSNPPVCKILDYSKFKYEQAKRLKETKKHRGGQLKEIRLRPHIGEHDLEVKLRHIREFLEEKNKVRITIMFMGREMTHLELGQVLYEKIKTRLSDIGEFPDSPNMLSNRMVFIIEPIKHKTAK